MKMSFCALTFYLLIRAIKSTQFSDSTDYTNDAPYAEEKIFRIKTGSNFNLRCNHKSKHDISWMFKPCDMNYKGLDCENNQKSYSWKFLRRGKKILTIENATLSNAGIYKCFIKNILKETFILEMDTTIYEWPPPKVISLIPNKNSIEPNKNLILSCNVESKSPPKILWFKECFEFNCEIQTYDIGLTTNLNKNDNCLCLISNALNNNTYNWNNLYISKLHIFNAHFTDSGTYVCSALSSDGKDYKTVSIFIRDTKETNEKTSYFILLIIPFSFILLYVLSYLFCGRKTEENNTNYLLTFNKEMSNKN